MNFLYEYLKSIFLFYYNMSELCEKSAARLGNRSDVNIVFLYFNATIKWFRKAIA